VEARQAHLDVIGNAENTGHSLCRRLRLELVAVASRKSGERDDPTLHSYGDVGRVEVRIPSQLVVDVSFDIAIGPHNYLSFVSVGHQIEDEPYLGRLSGGPWKGPPGTCHLNIGARADGRIDSRQFLVSFHTR